MTRRIETNLNTSDEGATSDVPLNSATPTTIKSAGDDFIYLSVINESNRDVRIILDSAIEFLPRGTIWVMPAEDRFIGEIQAIADSGTPTITINTY